MITETREPVLEGWIEDHKHEIDEAQACSIEELPDDPAAMSQAIALARAFYVRTGSLLTEAGTFVLRAHAAAVIETRRKFPECTADERRVIAKANETYVQTVRLKENLEIIVSALKSKCFEIMNARNNTLDRSGQQGGQ